MSMLLNSYALGSGGGPPPTPPATDRQVILPEGTAANITGSREFVTPGGAAVNEDF